MLGTQQKETSGALILEWLMIHDWYFHMILSYRYLTIILMISGLCRDFPDLEQAIVRKSK